MYASILDLFRSDVDYYTYWPDARYRAQTFFDIDIIFSFLRLQGISGFGQFQVRLVGVQNIEGVKYDGSCCDGSRSIVHGSSRCPPENCDTFFRICLQHYQETAEENGACTLGNATTPVIGKNSFDIPDSANRPNSSFQNPISMHFKFLWMVSFVSLLNSNYSHVLL